MSVDTSNLPEKLPASAGITQAASRIRSLGGSVESIYTDVDSEWKNITDHFKTTHDQQILGAPAKVMHPSVEAFKGTMDGVADALDDFESAVDGLRSRYNDVKSDARTHNAIPVADQSDSHSSDENTLQERVDSVANDYDAAVSTCSSAIRNLNPAYLLEGHDPSELHEINVPAYLFPLLGVAPRSGAATNAVVSQLSYKNGKLNFTFNTQNNPFMTQRGMPERYNISERSLRALSVPESYVERMMRASGVDPERLSSNKTREMLRNLPEQSALGWLVRKYPHLKSSSMSVNGRDVRLNIRLSAGNGTPPTNTRAPFRLPPGANKAMNALDKFGKVLTPLDYGVTFYGSFSEGYNDSLERNPDGTMEEHVRAATVDATVVTSSKAAGEIAGTIAGRAGGAALGQVLIPIPGVGAAVGGFVGGWAGGVVGSWAGEKVGGLINDLRHSEFASDAVSAVKDVGSAAVDTGKKVLGALNPFG
ncbi:hypothetical protein [Zhihengliuella halotolerans]|uniref:WXG100 family type VII secretion target n=1 Tax=Zhihengliuella halotolerans TaxID=370736 RepID=A0A4Q8AHV1_9MICC|nr:hypothetical protein [Zhihengliuella halotolerans]RZU63491.1 hypothetical protein EV380_3112 [Zhihengliuella halotolerans]